MRSEINEVSLRLRAAGIVKMVLRCRRCKRGCGVEEEKRKVSPEWLPRQLIFSFIGFCAEAEDDLE